MLQDLITEFPEKAAHQFPFFFRSLLHEMEETSPTTQKNASLKNRPPGAVHHCNRVINRDIQCTGAFAFNSSKYIVYFRYH